MTWSKSGVRPSYICACVSASGRHRHAALLARGDDVERRRPRSRSAPSPGAGSASPTTAPPPPTCVASGRLLFVARRGHPDRGLSRCRTYSGPVVAPLSCASMLAADVGSSAPTAPSWSASGPRRSSARRSWSPAGGAAGRGWRPAVGPGGALPAGLVDGAPAGGGDDRDRRDRRWSPRSPPPTRCRGSRISRGALRRGAAARARRPSRSPRCRSSSSSASGSSAPGSTPTCRSTCSRSTGSPPAAASG